MKTSIKFILTLIFTATCFSCQIYEPIEKVTPKNNETYKVEYLFEHDGCKVYRFRDESRYVYFTNCQGNTSSFSKDSVSVRVTTNTINRQ